MADHRFSDMPKEKLQRLAVLVACERLNAQGYEIKMPLGYRGQWGEVQIVAREPRRAQVVLVRVIAHLYPEMPSRKVPFHLLTEGRQLVGYHISRYLDARNVRFDVINVIFGVDDHPDSIDFVDYKAVVQWHCVAQAKPERDMAFHPDYDLVEDRAHVENGHSPNTALIDELLADPSDDSAKSDTDPEELLAEQAPMRIRRILQMLSQGHIDVKGAAARIVAYYQDGDHASA